jgi:riboflavin kinase/FMN adenylyltransferase
MKTALTIGFFDGVHLGHQALLKKLRAHPHTTILTFANHPRTVLSPPAPPLLLSLPEKLELLKPFADELLVVPFTLEMAQTPFEKLLDSFDLSHLLLGVGAAFGKDRQGNEERTRAYAAKRGFTVEYVPKLLFEGEPVSSSRIRKALSEKKMNLVNQLLGRP